MSAERALSGCRVVVTRAEVGELGRLLVADGAEVVHVPLIRTVPPADGGTELRRALARLDEFDWLIVTSAAGAEAVGAAAATHPALRLGAVGTATAARLAELCGRDVELIPQRQIAASLADEFIERFAAGDAQRVLLALGDRAAATLSDALSGAGHVVTRATAYRTELLAVSEEVRTVIRNADAVLFSSGSAAQSWVQSFGADAASILPPDVIAIGPTTEAIARELGLKVSAVAADHSLAGMVNELTRSWRTRCGG